jgi:hypothetical protein
VYKRSYTKVFDSYVVDVNNICWSMVCNEEQTDVALYTFIKLPITFIKWLNKHAPITVKLLNPSGLMRITEDNIRRYCHSYLPYLQFKSTSVPSGLEGRKSHSATKE